MIREGEFSQSNLHLRACVKHNKTNAFLALLSSVIILASSCRELYLPIPTERGPLSTVLGLLFIVALMACAFAIASCWQERVWLALATAACVVGVAKELFPGFVSPAITGVRIFCLLLWLTAVVLSLSFVKSAFGGGSPPDGHPME